jgi:CxxC motif-containing protein (DUF1111 family)
MSPAVVRGKRIWEQNNCMGCHTLSTFKKIGSA